MRSLLAVALLPWLVPDIAPNPRNRTGVGIAPRDTTAVAMRAEVVELTLHDKYAEVKAVFDLENTGDKQEDLEVGFPTEARPIEQDVATGAKELNSFSDQGLIYAFVAKVDGDNVHAEQKQVDAEDKRRVHRHWVCWPMRFDAGQKRRVEVRYEVETRDPLYVRPYSALQPRELIYVLKTGAGWKDVIGSARVLLRCADGLTFDHVETTSPAPTKKGEREWEWSFQNFEPDADVSIRYHVYKDAADAVATIAPQLQQRPDDPELLIDWAENKAMLGDHKEAAAAFVRIATWRDRGRFVPKVLTSRTYEQPAEYMAARSFKLAGNAAAAKEWAERAMKLVENRVANYQRMATRGPLRDRDAELLAKLTHVRDELWLLLQAPAGK